MGKNAVLLGGNWDNGANSGSRCSNWNNAPTNSDNNIGVRGVCEGVWLLAFTLFRCCYGTAGRPIQMWSAVLSCFGKYLWGFGKTTSSQGQPCAKVASGDAKVQNGQ